MKKIHLSQAEKAKFEHLHSIKRDGKERDRLKAILLASEGWSEAMIAQALRIHGKTVVRYLDDFGGGKLKNESGGSAEHLTKGQAEELIAHLEAHTYAHNQEIVMYIKERYGVSYTVSGLHKWLHRNNFSYKKPKGIPRKSAPELQRQFIEKYETLKTEKSREEAILFVDSVHPTQATKLSYGWIRTGKISRVHTTASRTRLNIVGAIELGEIANAVTKSYETINGETMIDFFQVIRSRYTNAKVIHLILDQAGYNKDKELAKAAKRLNIEMHFLPPYSPNLNPIERLWKVMNEHVRNNRFFNSAKEFRDTIFEFFDQTLPAIGVSLNSRINDNFQLL